MRQLFFMQLVKINKVIETGDRLRRNEAENFAGKTPKRASMTSCLNSGVCKLIGV
jgi:hypothetical protein